MRLGRANRPVLEKALGSRQLERLLARLVERNGILAILLALENVCEEKDQEKDGTWAEVAGIVGTASHNIPKYPSRNNLDIWMAGQHLRQIPPIGICKSYFVTVTKWWATR